MSITVSTDVFCDACPAWTHGCTGREKSVPAARAQARLRGWTHRGGRDLCPDCGDPAEVAKLLERADEARSAALARGDLVSVADLLKRPAEEAP